MNPIRRTLGFFVRKSIKDVQSAIERRFSIAAIKPIQIDVIRSMLVGRTVIGVMPTGYGKSLIYQSTSLLLKGVTIVVEPFIALIRDQIIEAERFGISCGSVHSDMSTAEASKLKSSLNNGTLKLLFVTPERFFNPEFLELCNTHSIAQIVIDEAHCISTMGDGFRPAYSRLGAVIQQINKTRSSSHLKLINLCFLTATLRADAKERIVETFGLTEFDNFEQPGERSNIRIMAKKVLHQAKLSALVDECKLTIDHGSLLIYVSDKLTGNILYERLSLRHLPVKLFHASISSLEKANVLQWYKDTPNAILISTSALSAGFHKTNIRKVIHFHPSRSIEEYVQEIGRAGRDGAQAEAILFYDPVVDEKLAQSLLKSSAPSLNLIASFAFWVSEKISANELSILTTARRLNLEYGLADLSTGALRTLLEHSRYAGAIDYMEKDGQFEISIFNEVDKNTLLTLVCNSDSTQDKFTKMKELIQFDGCKNSFITAYLHGDKSPAPAKCTCCIHFEMPKSNIMGSVLRQKIMELRTLVSKKHKVPVFTVMNSDMIENIINLRPTNTNDLKLIKGFDEPRIRLFGDKLLEICAQ